MIGMLKTCSKCRKTKQLSQFYSDSDGEHGVRAACKECWRSDARARFEKAKSTQAATKTCTLCKQTKPITAFATYQARCLSCQCAKAQEWRKNNPNYRQKTREYEARIKRLNTPVYQRIKLIHKLRSRIREALKNGHAKKCTSSTILLGCTIPELRVYLESKFTIGMSWKLIDEGKIHIDHIKPCAKFDLSSPDQQRQCFHYTNLQPLWTKDNLTKGSL